MPADASLHDVRRSAAAFLQARLALRRREARRTLLAGVALRPLVLAPAWLPVVVLVLWIGSPLDRPGLAGMIVVSFLLAALVAGAPTLLGLPGELRGLARDLGTTVAIHLRGPWERRIVAQLASAGRVPAAWLAAGAGRRWAARSLLARDAGVVRDDDGALRLLGSAPVECPGCGGALAAIGPCLRRCTHCARERFDPPPPVSPVFLRLQAARAGSFRDALRARRPDLDDALVALRRMAAVYVVVLVGLGLTERYPAPGWLAGALSIAVVVAPFGIAALGWGLVGAAVPLLRERWPQAVRYRYQLRDELARAVAEAGALTLGELEETLGVPRQTLDEQVAWMVASGELPVAVDHAAGRLVSRHAPATPTRCEGCAGALRPEPRGLVCQHCDRVALALRTGDPGAQAASDVGAAPAAPGAPPPRLALRLDAPAARIGEDVHGEVTVGFAGVRRCDGVRVRLVREVDGAGGDDEVAVRGEATLLQHAEVQGEATARFSLRVPADVVSHDGRTLAVRWRVAARLLGDDVVETAPLRVEPARRPPPDLEAHSRRLQAARRVDAAEYGAALVFVGVVIGIPGAAIVAFPAVATALALWEGERVGVGASLLAAASAYIMWRGLRWCVDGLWPWWVLRGRLRAPASAPLGAPLRATFDGRLAGCEATWELTHVERSGTTRSRTVRGRTQQSVDWVATRVRHAAGDVGPGGEIRCAIPAGGPSSCFVGLRRLEWELVVQLRRGGLSREVTAAIDVLPYLAADDADDADDAAAPAAPADATGP